MAFVPIDPTKAEVRTTQVDGQLMFDFYIPQGSKGDPGGIVNPSALGAGYDWNSLIVSGLYYAAGADMAGMPNSPPSMAVGVNIMVQARNAAVVTQIAWTTSNANNQIQFMRSLVSGTWGPWKVFRNTSIDNTAGKVITMWDETANRSQILYGDTGIRNLATILENGWTASNAKLRRFGDRVTLTVYNLSGTSSTTTTFYTLPVGFRPGGNTYLPVYTTAPGSTSVVIAQAADGALKLPTGVTLIGGAAYTEVSWTTTDTWPAALPGSAIGSIPNL